MKLTVSEYAKRLNVSVQTVYKKVRRGDLKTVVENNITYVIADDTEVKEGVEPKGDNYCNHLLKIIKTQQKEIKRLTKKNEKQNKFLIAKYENALPKPKDDIVDVNVAPKKKEKKSKKRRKDKK